ncbi:MAG TPA: hypothetical protein VGB73_16210 [Pyrinomonadaceae bacterium]|jgi:hypothetical protein
MKRRTCIGYIFLSLFVGLTAISASAQTGGRLTADVPFDFQVGSRALSAGEYTIRQLSSSNDGLLLLLSKGDKQSSMASTRVVEATRTSRRSRMVFNKYGERYFLASIWDSRGEGRILPQSAGERNARRETASIKNAAPEIVVVELALR